MLRFFFNSSNLRSASRRSLDRWGEHSGERCEPRRSLCSRIPKGLTGEAAGPACSPCPSEGHRVWKPPPLIPESVSSESSCPATNAPGPDQYKTRGYLYGNQARGGLSQRTHTHQSHTHHSRTYLLSVNVLADGSNLFVDLLFVFLCLMQLTVGFLKFRLFLLQLPKCKLSPETARGKRTAWSRPQQTPTSLYSSLPSSAYLLISLSKAETTFALSFMALI